MKKMRKLTYCLWILILSGAFNMSYISCQNDTLDSDENNKLEEPADKPSESTPTEKEFGTIFGVYTNPLTNLKYAFNSDGTYSISKNNTSIEEGTFTEQEQEQKNKTGSRFSRAMTMSSINYLFLLEPLSMGGAKANEKNPAKTELNILKTEKPGAIFENTQMFTKADLNKISEKSAITVWIESECLPKVLYKVASGINIEKITDTISARNNNMRWFRYYFENCEEISISVKYESEMNNFEISDSTVYISKDKKTSVKKPENFYFNENYRGESEKLYLMGTFSYDKENTPEDKKTQWKAINNFNNFTEIDKGIYKLSMYLPQNIYGFKISMTGFSYDYCIPFEVKGSVQKNKWFEIVKSEYSTWYGKNGALATGGGYYNFFLDLSDEANPIMLIATDEQSDKVVEDANLYVVGDFTGWKFDEKYQLAETEKGSGIYSLRESVEIPVSKDGNPQGFSISDKTWGAMTGSYGQNWTRTEDIKLLENQYIAVDETYATRTQNNNLKYFFNGTYNFYLNVNTSEVKVEKTE